MSTADSTGAISSPNDSATAGRADSQMTARLPRWYMAYFALALFDVLTVSVSLWLNHRLTTSYTEAVTTNATWASHAGHMSEIRRLAGAVNAPGNDVFDSRDVSGESARMESALTAFNSALANERAEFVDFAVAASGAQLLSGLTRVDRAMNTMTAEARQIFGYFSADRPDLAGQRMATMDRSYAFVNAEIAVVENLIRSLQRQELEAQRNAAHTWQRLEAVIGAFVVMMVCGAIFYGHRIHRQMVTNARERARFIAELGEARDAALTAARVKSEFLANMSHEIRTPMNGVLGMTELLLKSPLNSQQRRFAETVNRSANGLLHTLNEILDFSKIEAGKLTLDHAPFDLHVLIEDLGVAFAEQASRKGLELTCDVPAEVPIAVAGDATRLRQVLTNLLGNACKFTEQGEVGVRVRAADVTESCAVLRFEVHDTGIGVPAEAQSRIFESFAQADSSTTRRFGGTGLGLAICRKLVELMGGQIGLEDRPGGGSVFWFTLPLLRESEPAGQPPRPPLAEAPRVLIVDDNATNREILASHLAAWGIASACVQSGAEALAELANSVGTGDPFGLAILDMHMPAMDGLQLSRVIRADPRFNGLRIILLSSIADAISRADRDRYDIAYSLTKPVRAAELHHTLAAVIGTDAMATATGGLQTSSAAESRNLSLDVLLAEDNLVNQFLAVEMLKNLGCQVRVAADGNEAVAARRRENFDVVLMDCQMPNLDGFEATRQIRALEAAAGQDRTPIIALTANALIGDRERCLEAGMDDYLAKPFTLEQLQTILARLPASAASPARG